MSMAVLRSSNSYDPSCRCPLMKNVGVPFTPLRTPPRKSARTLEAYSLLAKALRKSDTERPRPSVKANSRGKPRCSWLSKIWSCISQNRPCAPANSAPSAAASALGWICLKGKCLKTKIQVLGEVLLHHIDNRMSEAAMRALVIAILYEGYRRTDRTPDVITPRDWNF